MPSPSELEQAISDASDALFKFRVNDVTSVCVGTARELATAALQAASPSLDFRHAGQNADLYDALSTARAALAEPGRRDVAALIRRIDELLAARPKE